MGKSEVKAVEGCAMENKETTKYSMNDPIFAEFGRQVYKTRGLCFKFDHTEPNSPESRAILSEIFEGKLDSTVSVELGIRLDMPSKVCIGKNILIGNNFNCDAMGGVVIEDGVMIAHQVSLLTVNHDLHDHRILVCSPIHIKKNAWIGAKATILQGITIGENAVVGAGAVVTKDVPDNTVVGGIPAKVIKVIE
jgi:acetyltransferase-like isoleucine patch superfamily enzyme